MYVDAFKTTKIPWPNNLLFGRRVSYSGGLGFYRYNRIAYVIAKIWGPIGAERLVALRRNRTGYYQKRASVSATNFLELEADYRLRPDSHSAEPFSPYAPDSAVS